MRHPSRRLCLLACPVVVRTEVWALLPERYTNKYGHRYEVSSTGRLRNIRTGKLLSPYPHRTGYMVVKLANTAHYVHRLVLTGFVRDPMPGEEGDHLDFDRHNNSITNLRWLPKNVNAWRWKFWTDQPEDTGEEYDEAWATMTDAEYEARGFGPKEHLRPEEQHRHLEGATT